MSTPNVSSGKFGVQRGAGKRKRKHVYYGTGSVGKTTLAASAPRPFIICLEDGAAEFKCPKSEFDTTTGRVYPLTYQEIVDYLEWLPKSGQLTNVETLVLDGIHQLDQLIQTHVVKQNSKWTTIQTPGFGTGEAAVLDVWRSFIAKLDDICLRLGLRLILAGHAQITKFKNPEGAEYNRYDLAVTTHTKGDVAGFLFGWCDVFGFCRFEQLTQEIGKRTVALSQQGSRLLQLEWTNAYQAKCRVPGAPGVLPMTNPDGTPSTWAEVWGPYEDAADAPTAADVDEFKRLLPEVSEETQATWRGWLEKNEGNAVALGNALRKLRDQVSAVRAGAAVSATNGGAS